MASMQKSAQSRQRGWSMPRNKLSILPPDESVSTAKAELGVSETVAGLNRVIHEPARLAILTVLTACESADFVFLRTATGLTAGNLSVPDRERNKVRRKKKQYRLVPVGPEIQLQYVVANFFQNQPIRPYAVLGFKADTRRSTARARLPINKHKRKDRMGGKSPADILRHNTVKKKHHASCAS